MKEVTTKYYCDICCLEVSNLGSVHEVLVETPYSHLKKHEICITCLRKFEDAYKSWAKLT